MNPQEKALADALVSGRIPFKPGGLSVTFGPEELHLEGGKYTLVLDNETGRLEALRYGQPWRDLTGDKLMLSVFSAAVELKHDYDSLKPHPGCDRSCMFLCQQPAEPEVTDAMALAFHHAQGGSAMDEAGLEAIKVGLRAALLARR